jgi:hypothetical protein
MMKRGYWLDLFTGATWGQFQNAGSSVSGFRESRWKTVQKVAKGDYFLCYLTAVSRFIGILEVTSEPFKRAERDIWKDNDFPCQFNVKPIVELTPETAVPVFELRDQLSFLQNLKSPHVWTGHFRSSPAKWKQADGEAVVRALFEAKENPVNRPVDKRKLKYRPAALRAKIGSATVPDSNGDEPEIESELKEPKKPTEHTERQWLFLKLGSDMGFDVWVAQNDRGKEFKGKSFSELTRLKSDLPLRFDDATNKTIELIDVLCLQGNAITAAFEIELTTSIY